MIDRLLHRLVGLQMPTTTAPTVTMSTSWLLTHSNHMSDDWMLRYVGNQIDPRLIVEPDESSVVWRRRR